MKKAEQKLAADPRASRDRISTMLLEELAKDFEEPGPEVIRGSRALRDVRLSI